MKLTPFAKFVVVVAILAAAFFSMKKYAPDLFAKIVPAAKEKESKVPLKADLPSADAGADAAAAAKVEMPGAEPGCTDKPEVRFLIWAWNAQMGGLFANGGPQAAKGSLMCKNGVNLKFIREDDTGKMQEALVTFATELSKGSKNPSKGAHFIAIMGDGSAAFLKGINDALSR